MMPLKCCSQCAGKLGKLSSGLEKVSFILIPKKSNAKECSNTAQLHISHANKLMLKIIQARLQQYVNQELSDVQARFRKGKEPEINLPTSDGSSEKQENSSKTSASSSLTMLKPLTVWITTHCRKF